MMIEQRGGFVRARMGLIAAVALVLCPEACAGPDMR